MQHLHNRQARVDANEIGQLQRSHGHIRPVLHDGIDIVPHAHASLQTDDGLVDIRHQDAVRQESRRVGGLGWDLAHGLAEGYGGIDGGLAGLQAGDDLDALLDGHGVHEVRGDDAGRRRGVGGVGGGSRGDAGDGYRRGVSSQDSVRRADLGERAEDVELERRDLGHGFDNEVDVREGVHGRGGCEEGPDLVRLILRDAFLRHVFGQQFVCRYVKAGVVI
jgi:hypothetical protein